jgi:hypothetical protein
MNEQGPIENEYISLLKIHLDSFKEKNYEIFGKGISTSVGSLNFEPLT